MAEVSVEMYGDDASPDIVVDTSSSSWSHDAAASRCSSRIACEDDAGDSEDKRQSERLKDAGGCGLSTVITPACKRQLSLAGTVSSWPVRGDTSAAVPAHAPLHWPAKTLEDDACANDSGGEEDVTRVMGGMYTRDSVVVFFTDTEAFCLLLFPYFFFL